MRTLASSLRSVETIDVSLRPLPEDPLDDSAHWDQSKESKDKHANFKKYIIDPTITLYDMKYFGLWVFAL